jgi:hypothetical protein
MSDLAAQHYLGIYQTRLHMVEKGITHPKPEVVAGMRRLVSGLCSLEPTTKSRLELQPGWALFKIAATGELVAQIEFNDPAEPGAPPNGGPGSPSDRSGPTAGPPSVS